MYHPLRDETMSLKDRGEYFMTWVASYFEKAPDLDSATAPLLAARRIIQEGPPSEGAVDTSKTPTVYRMSPEELESVIDREALERSSFTLFRVSKDVLHQNFLRSLFDTGGVWPGVKALLVWCDESMHDCVWAAKVITEFARQPRGVECTERVLEVERLSDANHFVGAMLEAGVRDVANQHLVAPLGYAGDCLQAAGDKSLTPSTVQGIEQE